MMKNRRAQLVGGAAAAVAAALSTSSPSHAVQLEVDRFGRTVVIEAPTDLQGAVAHYSAKYRSETGAILNINCKCEQC